MKITIICGNCKCEYMIENIDGFILCPLCGNSTYYLSNYEDFLYSLTDR